MSLEGVERSGGTDGEWQIVPYTSYTNSKCSVADSAEQCMWN